MEKVNVIYEVIWVVPTSDDPDENVFFESVYSTHFDLVSALGSLRDFRSRNPHIPTDMTYIIKFVRDE